jgi:hypothetical protein
MDTLPLQFLILTVAGWISRRQQDVIEYLLEENRILREHVGDRRLQFTDTQRRSLATMARKLSRKTFDQRQLTFPTGKCRCRSSDLGRNGPDRHPGHLVPLVSEPGRPEVRRQQGTQGRPPEDGEEYRAARRPDGPGESELCEAGGYVDLNRSALWCREEVPSHFT